MGGVCEGVDLCGEIKSSHGGKAISSFLYKDRLHGNYSVSHLIEVAFLLMFFTTVTNGSQKERRRM